jgi:hypothetical protein
MQYISMNNNLKFHLSFKILPETIECICENRNQNIVFKPMVSRGLFFIYLLLYLVGDPDGLLGVVGLVLVLLLDGVRDAEPGGGI